MGHRCAGCVLSSRGLTEVIVEESKAGADRRSVLQFMTTEHFTLQTARATANAG